MRNALFTTTLFGGLCALASTAAAEITITDNFSIGGRVRQGIAFAYDPSIVRGGGVEVGQMNYVFEVNSTWKPAQTVTVTGNFWLRGDWYSDLGGDLVGPGIPDYASPGYTDLFDYHLNRRGGGRPAGAQAVPPGDPFGSNDHQNRFLSDFNDEMIREAAIKLTDPGNRFGLKIGKFVRGWGQSDGLRLLDVLHAQDFRQKFIFGDSDEMRIPSWMAAVEFNFDQLGMGEPFRAIGIKKPKIELIYMPEYHHDQFIINNATPGNATSGGLYGFPYPALIDKGSDRGIPFFGAHLTDRSPARFNFLEPTLAGRFQFQVFGGEATLNALYAYQELPIVKLTGSNLVIGNAFHDERNAAAVIPLTLEQTQGAVQAPGAYVSYLRSANPTVEGIQNIFGCDGSAGPTCSVNVKFDLDYRYRRKLIGGSFTRDMSELPMGPKDVTPVFRTEFAYEFDKPFNRSTATTLFGVKEEGTAALIVDPANGVTKRDQISVMTGFDYFLWVPFWTEQASSVFTSVQLFTIVTPNAKELLFQAPYSAYGAKLHGVQNYGTFLYNHNFDDGRLFVEGLGVYDVQNRGWGIRQRFDFNYFGDNIRPRIELTHFDGRREQGVFGIMDQVDNVEFSLTFQF